MAFARFAEKLNNILRRAHRMRHIRGLESPRGMPKEFGSRRNLLATRA